MADLRFRILNVFTIAGDRFSGNALCVFEDGSSLSDAQMQAIARQFNLSETTFLLPATTAGATARVRFFTPSFEMPFAGHPTLGTAHVARDLHGGDRLTLEMKAGLVEVTAAKDAWTLCTAGSLSTRAPEASRAELAETLGVPVDAILASPLWVDTGAEQLVVPLASADVLRAAQPKADLIAKHSYSVKRGASMVYAWAKTAGDGVVARFFFVANGSVIEDPATGSACANLGGWLLTTGERGPLTREVRQGEAVERPSILRLRIDGEQRIYVGGDVIEVGRGTMAVVG